VAEKKRGALIMASAVKKALTLDRIALEAPGAFRLGSLVLVGEGTVLGIRPTIVITRSMEQVEPEALAEYVEDEIREVRRTPGFRQIDRTVSASMSGLPAILQRHQFRERKVMLEQLQIYVATPNEVTIGTATHAAGRPFSEMLPRFEEILRSISER
jgi:hypothetical protein